MKRLIETKLNKWMEDSNRKPLLINGMRQVGKTWIVKKFGDKEFDNMIYVNFDTEPMMCDIFKKSKDPKKIIFELSILFEKKIDLNNTLIFFDEIQECNEALNSLKYFCESEDKFYIIGAGSYLGIALSKGNSFPVGKVDLLEMKPMTYKEFLIANGEKLLVEYIENYDSVDQISEPIFEKMSRYFREYYIVGGMPEAVLEWIKEKDIKNTEKTQLNILNTYQRDFSKYPSRSIMPKIIDVWDSIVSQLARENKKFKYSEIRNSARAREYEEALNWLIAGNYVKKVCKIEKNLIPISAYKNDKHFKLFMSDIGLLREKADFPAATFSEINDKENIPFKGALAENIVFQELSYVLNKELFYWTANNQEIDFMIQINQSIYPIEVKYGKNINSKSLAKYIDDNLNCIGIRYSMRNLTYNGKILNIPFGMISETLKLIEIVRKF